MVLFPGKRTESRKAGRNPSLRKTLYHLWLIKADKEFCVLNYKSNGIIKPIDHLGAGHHPLTVECTKGKREVPFKY